MENNWVETETAGCDLGDVRLNRRLEAMLGALGERPGESLPPAFQDWSNTKAAYRFFSNGNVSEDRILEGHFAASAMRLRATDGPILILQDTTEFSFKRSAPEKVGFTKISTGRKLKEGRYQKHAICGLLMHASLAITPEGLPLGKQRKYRHQELQIIHAEELDPPEGRAPVFWKLITNLPVETHADAVHKLDWYALRWKSETFFRTLKTGCRIEKVRLTTADRLANYIALCSVVAWRVSWLTMLGRRAPAASPAAVFTEMERRLLQNSMPKREPDVPPDLGFYIRAVARLGGYLDRAADAPPGITVIWRGFSRLANLAGGARLAGYPASSTCG